MYSWLIFRLMLVVCSSHLFSLLDSLTVSFVFSVAFLSHWILPFLAFLSSVTMWKLRLLFQGFFFFIIVMVNFIRQFDWIPGWPDIWINIVSGCVCESVSRWVRLSRWPPCCGWMSSSPLKACREQKGEEGGILPLCFLPACFRCDILLWAGVDINGSQVFDSASSQAFDNPSFPGSAVCRRQIEGLLHNCGTSSS